MEAMKPNDWLATLVKNPDMNLADLKRNGITADNTGLKSKDEYKKMQAVKESPAFINEKTNQFDEDKFNQYYDTALALYNQYANDAQIDKAVEFAYASDAFWAPSGAKRSDITSTIALDNPYKEYDQGISYITAMDVPESKLSVRELAQTQDAVDSQTGKSLGWTPNDYAGSMKGLFKSFSRPTLVLAQYDSNGTHKNAEGVWVEHTKGEYKLNAEGKPYYETLGGRDIYGRDVLRVSDTLTVDGGKFNKIDLFDSDGVKKSAGKVAAKTFLTVAAMMIPYVGEVYGYTTAATALARVMPVIGKTIDSAVFGNDENQFGKAMSVWEGYMARLDPTQSDRSRSKQITLENFGNLITSISGQLFQQRAVANMGYLMSKNPEVARQLSFAYMAATSSQDNYEAFKEAGLSDRATGLAMIGSMAALHGLMNSDYFREYSVFKGGMMDESPVLVPARKIYKEVAGELVEKGIVKEAEKAPMSFLTKCRSIYSKKFVEGLTASEFVNRSVAEGVEEVMEEFSTDMVKAFNKGLDAIGVKVTEEGQDLDFGISLEDIASRYSMNFFGGLIGGGIFYGQNKWENFVKNGKTPKLDKDTSKQLVYLIAEGHGDELKSYFTKWHKKGWLGSPNLSASTETVTTLNGTEVVSTTQGKSQNDLVYDLLINFVDEVEQQVKTSAPFFSKNANWDELKVYGYDVAAAIANPNLLNASGIAELQTHSTMYSDTVDSMAEIVRIKSDIAARTKEITKDISGDTADAESKRKKAISEDKKLKDLNKELKEKQDFLDAVFKGEKTKYYAGQAIFYANSELNKKFGNLSLDAFAQEKYGASIDTFNDETKAAITEDYNKYQDSKGKARVYQAYDVYLAMSKRWGAVIQKEAAALKEAYEEGLLDAEIIGEDYRPDLKRLEELDVRREELIKKETRTDEDEEELRKIAAEIAEMDDKVAKITSNPKFALLRGKSAREFYNMFTPDGEGGLRIDTQALAQFVRDHYKGIAEKKGYSINDDMLELLLRQVKEDFAASAKQGIDPDIFVEEVGGEIDTESEFNDKFNDSSEELKRLYTLFFNNLGKNNKGAIEAYNSLVNLLKTLGLSEEQINDIFYDRDRHVGNMPLIENKPIIEFLREISELKAKCKHSIYAELANQFSIDYNGKRVTIFDLLNQETDKLAYTERISDYIINDPSFIELFAPDSELSTLLGGMEGVVAGMVDGTNLNINNFKGGTIENLAVLDNEQATVYEAQCLDTLAKIEFLLNLSNRNRAQALTVQKDIALNMRPKFIEVLLNDGVSSSFASIFSWTDSTGTHSISPNEIWKKVNPDVSLETVTDNNYYEVEKAIIKFENALYEAIQEANFTDQDLASRIIRLRNGNALIEMTSTKMSTLKKEDIQPYDVCMYVATMASMAADDFYGRLKEKVPELATPDGKGIAPIYAQEFALRLATAMMAKKGLFNALLDELNKEELVSKYDSPSVTKGAEKKSLVKQLKHRPVLYNMAVVLGSAGSGKTVGVGGTLVKLLDDPEVEFIAVGPEKDQAEKIAKQLGTDITSFSKNDFFKEAFGEEVGKYWFKEEDGEEIDHIEAKSSGTVRSQVFSGSKKCKVLVVDEIGKMNEAELQKLCQWAKETNTFIIGLGDLKQSVSVVKAKHKSGARTTSVNTYTCLEDCVYVKAPLLTTSLRLENLAKFDNYVYLDTLLNEIRDKIHPETSIKAADALVTRPVQLYYYEDDKTLCGEKVVEKEEQMMADLEKLVKANPDKEFAIITDNPSKPEYEAFVKKYDSAKISIVPYSSMQGGEWDYAFVDVDFTKDANKFNLLRAVYTLSQRSRIGTLMINKGIFGDGRLNLEKNNGSVESGKQSVGKRSNKEIEAFKEWRLGSIRGVTEREGFMNKILADYKDDPEAVKKAEEEARKAAEEEARKAREEAERVRLEEERRREEEAKKKEEIVEPEDPEEVAPVSNPLEDTGGEVDEGEGEVKGEETPPKKISETEDTGEGSASFAEEPESPLPPSTPMKKKLTFSNQDFFEMLASGQLSRFSGISGLGVDVMEDSAVLLASMIASIVRCKGTAKQTMQGNTFVTMQDWYDIIFTKFDSRSPIVKALEPYATNKSKLWVSRLDGTTAILTYRAYNEEETDFIEFPVAIIPGCTAYGEYTGEIKLKKKFKINQKVRGWAKLKNTFAKGIYKFLHQSRSVGIIVGKESEISNDPNLSNGTKKTLIRNLGRTYTVVSDEWYLLNKTSKSDTTIWNTEKGNAITDYDRVALVGCQVSISASDVFHYLTRVATTAEWEEKGDAEKLFEYLRKLPKNQRVEDHVDINLLSARGKALDEIARKKKFQVLPATRAGIFIDALLQVSPVALTNLSTLLGYNGGSHQKVLVVKGSLAVVSNVVDGQNQVSIHSYKNGRIGKEIYSEDTDKIPWDKVRSLCNNKVISASLLDIKYTKDKKTGKVKNRDPYTMPVNEMLYLLTRGILGNPSLVEEISSQIDATESFSHGIFAQETAGERTSSGSYFRVSENKGERYSKAVEFKMSQYNIDTDQIVKEESESTPPTPPEPQPPTPPTTDPGTAVPGTTYETINRGSIVRRGREVPLDIVRKTSTEPAYGVSLEVEEAVAHPGVTKVFDALDIDKRFLILAEGYDDEPELILNGVDKVKVVRVRKIVAETGEVKYVHDLEVYSKDGAHYSNGNELDAVQTATIMMDTPLNTTFFPEDAPSTPVQAPEVTVPSSISGTIRDNHPDIVRSLGSMADTILAACDSTGSVEPINSFFIETSKTWKCKQVVLNDNSTITVETKGDEFFDEWFCKKNNIDINSLEEIYNAESGGNDSIAYIIDTCGYAYFYVSLLDGTTKAFYITRDFPTGRELSNMGENGRPVTDVMDAVYRASSYIWECVYKDPDSYATSDRYMRGLLSGSNEDFGTQFMNELIDARTYVSMVEKEPDDLFKEQELAEAKDRLARMEQINELIVDFLQKKLELDDECL